MNKSILSAANILLTTFNDDSIKTADKVKIFEAIDEICIESLSNIIDHTTKEYNKRKILNVIEETKNVLD